VSVAAVIQTLALPAESLVEQRVPKKLLMEQDAPTAADRDCLELFRRLCRHYWDIDPAATAGYVHAYREMWDSDEPGKNASKA
jgi:hypothetical protein